MVARRTDLYLPPDLVEQIVAHARAGYPEEVCGLISGQDGKPLAIHPGRNVSPTPRVAYEMDVETVALQIEFEHAGLELFGIYHSHPHGPPDPSPTDIERSMYPRAIHVIVDLTDFARPVVGAFWIDA